MKNLIILLVLNGLFISNGCCQSYDKAISTYESKYQKCLDSGQAMLSCTVIYYNSMDSLLNLVYNKLKSTYSVEDRKRLKKEELEWIANRDLYFKKADKQAQAQGLGDEDTKMVALDLKAEFVKKRVIELANRLKK